MGAKMGKDGMNVSVPRVPAFRCCGPTCDHLDLQAFVLPVISVEQTTTLLSGSLFYHSDSSRVIKTSDHAYPSAIVTPISSLHRAPLTERPRHCAEDNARRLFLLLSLHCAAVTIGLLEAVSQ